MRCAPFDSAGNLFAADFNSGNIYKFTPDGGQSTFASGLSHPLGLAFDSAGNLFVASSDSGNIYEFSPGGVQSTFASGLFGPVELAFHPAPELQPAWTNAMFQLTVTMPSPYYSTIVQASTNLVNWVNIYTNTPPYTFTDSTGTNLSGRYYRALLGP